MTQPAISFDDQNDAAPEGIQAHGSAMGRAAALLEAIGQGELAADSGASYDSDDDDDGQVAPPAPAVTTKAKPAQKDEPAEKNEPAAAEPNERAQKIEQAKTKLKAETEARRHSQALEQERAQLAQEREQIQQILRQVEPFQKAMKDPRAFIELARDYLDPEQLSAALPEMMSDESRQKWRLKSTETNVKTEFEKALEAKLAPLVQRLEAYETRERESVVERVHSAFREHVTSNADETPGFAALIARNPAKARALADEVANGLAKRGELPETMAERYAVVAKAIEEDLFAGIERAPATSSAKTSEKRPAAGKANPLGNRVSSERSAIKVDDSDEEHIDGDSLEARTRAAERALRGQPLSKVF